MNRCRVLIISFFGFCFLIDVFAMSGSGTSLVGLSDVYMRVSEKSESVGQVSESAADADKRNYLVDVRFKMTGQLDKPIFLKWMPPAEGGRPYEESLQLHMDGSVFRSFQFYNSLAELEKKRFVVGTAPSEHSPGAEWEWQLLFK